MIYISEQSGSDVIESHVSTDSCIKYQYVHTRILFERDNIYSRNNDNNRYGADYNRKSKFHDDNNNNNINNDDNHIHDTFTARNKIS